MYETQSALSNFPWRPMGYDGIKSLFFIPSYICTTLGGSTGCVWTCSMYQVQRYSVNNNTPGLVYAIIVRNFSLTLRLNALILLLCCRQTPAIIAKSCFLSGSLQPLGHFLFLGTADWMYVYPVERFLIKTEKNKTSGTKKSKPQHDVVERSPGGVLYSTTAASSSTIRQCCSPRFIFCSAFPNRPRFLALVGVERWCL